MPPIILEPAHASAADELTTALVDWNERQVGPRNCQPFTLSIRGDDGELLAGLVGEMFWSFLYISVVWVKEEHRAKRYGSVLIERAEQMAGERPCSVAFLNTMSFQAPGAVESGSRRS